MGIGKMLPDELEHQQLVKIRIEQRPSNGIEFPVMVVRASCKVDNHYAFNVPEVPKVEEVWPP